MGLTDETREFVQVREIAVKEQFARHYNKKVFFPVFKKGNLVLRR